MIKNKLASIIIRTKNEEKWLEDCIKSIKQQDYKFWEIIVVDNYSTDKTEKICKKNNIKVLKIKYFKPGKAINIGIKASSGNYLIILSAHCIPQTKSWLSNFIKKINIRKIAAVYGRQIPLKSSSNQTKRDLKIVFGLDEKIQKKDPYFNNANSCIKRNVWLKYPFDENLTNIEDRIWAKNILKKGWNILYTPSSCVYHYHGIHQDNDKTRLKQTVNILSKLDKENTKKKINFKMLKNKYD